MCEVRHSVEGRKVEGSVGGYSGKTEGETPYNDLKYGHRIWYSGSEAKKLPEEGSEVKVLIGGKKFTGKVEGWTGDAKQVVLDKEVGKKLTENQIEELLEKNGYETPHSPEV